MPIKKLIVCFVFVMLVCSCSQNSHNVIEPQIIPTPKNQSVTQGYFLLNNVTGVQYNDSFKVSAKFLKAYIEKGSQIKLTENNTISFIKDETLTEEAYVLEILPKNITIKAKTDQGAFYAVQSLRQLLQVAFEKGSFKEEEVAIQCMTIEDEPRFQYRGMHLDVARHMVSVDFIKKYIDALAMLKMNTFHWHLTDDQGWRIEIKKYPNLQEIAAFREQTLVGHFSDQPTTYDGKRYGGYYTQEEIKEVVAYALKQHITVIPEIEMPGHAQAAIAAYPELGCSGDSIKVAQTWGVFDDIFCAGKEYTFTFLEGVLDEVVELFPSKFIHIGGDEAPKTHWKNCQVCQKRIKEEGLKDEHELQSYFIQRIEKHLNSNGRQIIGWDEILEGGLAPNATVMSWRGTKGAVEAAKQDHKVIMTPTSHCYFDYYQSTNPNEPLAIGGYLPLEKVYSFNPIPKELNHDEAQYVLGVQGNLWTEYIPNAEHVEYMIFPRILAMSEVGWSLPENKNYDDFVSRVETFNKRLDALDVNYANHLYEVEGELFSENGLSFYTLKTLTKDKTIRYTTDESQPNLQSQVYEKPIPFNKDMVIKAAVFNEVNQLGSIFTETFNYHKAVGKTITITPEPSKVYSGSGSQGLINGISGSDLRYGDKEWLGFWGDDVEIEIDLSKAIEINSIETRFYNGQGQWIYAPKEFEIEFDNETENQIVKIPDSDDNLVNVSLEKKVQTRFIKIRIPNYGVIPEGNQGSGHKAWTFIDEIIIK
ncbi:glycoside hydrolase family 20 protein [Hanstruepera ponticola]|uniref:glycoside hydrolase family 20 protein n=1 Tax=Hanstruepera ponticola TaxID=2042995 RepID=UPI000CF0BA6C|nr:glycoside hydrolase family 20 protein [Hanstruepera ponticola]